MPAVLAATEAAAAVAAHDFALSPSSPALTLGFQAIDQSQIGLKSDWMRRRIGLTNADAWTQYR